MEKTTQINLENLDIAKIIENDIAELINLFNQSEEKINKVLKTKNGKDINEEFIFDLGQILQQQKKKIFAAREYVALLGENQVILDDEILKGANLIFKEFEK